MRQKIIPKMGRGRNIKPADILLNRTQQSFHKFDLVKALEKIADSKLYIDIRSEEEQAIYCIDVQMEAYSDNKASVGSFYDYNVYVFPEAGKYLADFIKDVSERRRTSFIQFLTSKGLDLDKLSDKQRNSELLEFAKTYPEIVYEPELYQRIQEIDQEDIDLFQEVLENQINTFDVEIEITTEYNQEINNYYLHDLTRYRINHRIINYLRETI